MITIIMMGRQLGQYPRQDSMGILKGLKTSVPSFPFPFPSLKSVKELDANHPAPYNYPFPFDFLTAIFLPAMRRFIVLFLPLVVKHADTKSVFGVSRNSYFRICVFYLYYIKSQQSLM